MRIMPPEGITPDGAPQFLPGRNGRAGYERKGQGVRCKKCQGRFHDAPSLTDPTGGALIDNLNTEHRLKEWRRQVSKQPQGIEDKPSLQRAEAHGVRRIGDPRDCDQSQDDGHTKQHGLAG